MQRVLVESVQEPTRTLSSPLRSRRSWTCPRLLDWETLPWASACTRLQASEVSTVLGQPRPHLAAWPHMAQRLTRSCSCSSYACSCQLRWRPPTAGIRLKSSSLQTLLYLCSGGDDWHLQVPPPAATPTAQSCAPLGPAFLEAFPESVELRASNPAGQDPAEPMQASDDGSVGGSVQEPEPPEQPMIPTLGQEASPVQVSARRTQPSLVPVDLRLCPSVYLPCLLTSSHHGA